MGQNNSLFGNLGNVTTDVNVTIDNNTLAKIAIVVVMIIMVFFILKKGILG